MAAAALTDDDPRGPRRLPRDPPGQPRSARSTRGDCFLIWRVPEVEGEWRVAAQLVERFDDMNDKSQRLFATPLEGLNT